MFYAGPGYVHFRDEERSNAPAERRLGVAKGRFTVPDSIDEHNAELAALFEGTGPARASTPKKPRTAS